MVEIGFFEKGKGVFRLKPEGVKEAHQGFVGFGSLGRAVLETPVPQDHMRADHPLSQVVVERNLRDLKKGEEMNPVFEEAFGKPHQVPVAVFPAGPEEETLFQEPDSPLVDGYPKGLPIFFKPQGISKNPFQDLVIFQKRLRGVFETELAHLPQEMDEALLFLSREPVVGRIEVGDEDTPVVLGKNLLRDLGSPALGDLVVGKPFIHHRPEPVIRSAHLPAGLIHMKMGAGTDGFKNLIPLHLKPLTNPLKSLSQGPFRDSEMAERFKQFFDLIEGKAVVIFENYGLD